MIEEMLDDLDFISIGTNDLSQYTLAADRQNPLVEHITEQKTPILRLIKYIVETAKKKNKWVGVCGEYGKETDLAEFFIALGVKELSVAVSHITELRKTIRNINLEEKEKLIEKKIKEDI